MKMCRYLSCSATDNSRFASCGKEKTVFLWDVTTATTLRRISGHDEVTDGSLTYEETKHASHKSFCFNQRVNSLSFNQEGTVLVSGSYDRTIKCWDLRSNDRNAIQSMSDCKDSVTTVKLTEDAVIARFGLVSQTLPCTLLYFLTQASLSLSI